MDGFVDADARLEFFVVCFFIWFFILFFTLFFILFEHDIIIIIIKILSLGRRSWKGRLQRRSLFYEHLYDDQHR